MSEQNQEPNAGSLTSRILSWVPNLKFLRRIIVAVIGFTVLLLGIAMIVLPGPAFIVIPLGLAIRATEFVWDDVLLKKAKAYFEKAKNKTLRKTSEDG